MTTKILKSFSSLGCEAQLQLITFDESKLEIYQVAIRTLVVPKGCNSCYQVSVFGENEHDAKVYFRKMVSDFV